MNIELILEILILLSIGCLFVFKKYLFSYGAEKGKNLATKEDVEEIADKIESIKHEYTKQLDSARAELSAQINTHGFRYEKEYEVLSELTSLLVDSRDAVLRLRPELDFTDSAKTEDQIKSERLKAYFQAHWALYTLKEKKRPFFPQDIYGEISEIEKIAITESSEYIHKDPFLGLKYMDYWEKAEKNRSQILAKTESAMKKIRERVVKWDSLQGGL